MNRKNIWIHLGLALVIISFAAVLGQIARWKGSLRSHSTDKTVEVSKRQVPVSRSDPRPELIVRFRPDVPLAEIRRIAAKYNDTVDDKYENIKGLVLIDDLDDADTNITVEQYTAMSGLVEYAEANERIYLDDPADDSYGPASASTEAPNFPNDPEFGQQWGLNNTGQEGGKAGSDVSALKAWEKTKGSEDVVVAVLDTGVDYNHQDLRSNMWTRPADVPEYRDEELGSFNDINGFNADANIADPMDDNGHGTHCAGIVGAEGNNGEGIAGVNWNVQIMPLKFLGRGGFGSTANAIEAINYAIDRKQNGVNIRIISASWGSTSRSKALEDAIRAAGENGILFVAAAGNASTDNDKRPHFPSNYKLPNVISVAATDNNDQLASFSNFGAKTVHIAAPGRQIVSTWMGGAYREASGTSMATPYVSAVAALIVARDPHISVERLREKLLSSVDKIDSLNGKVATGGRLNAAKAVAK